MVDDTPEVDDAEELAAIEDFDFAKVMMLLNVMEKQVNVAPKATSIFGIAALLLNKMNDEAKDIALAHAQKIRDADALRAQAEQERIQHDADEQAAQELDQSPPRVAGPRVLRSGQTPAQEPLVPGQPTPGRRAPTPETDRRV